MIQKHADSIGHAWDGLTWSFKTQSNFKIHFLLIFLSILGGFLFKISYVEWIAVLITTYIGLIIEVINTAIEKMGDAIDLNYNENIKISKDVSAASMLIFSVGAFAVACLIFLPKIFHLLTSIK